METTNYDANSQKHFDLMSFDLGEAGGGKQMIFAHKAVSETEHYVFALGNPPQTQPAAVEDQAAAKAPADSKTSLGKQIIANLRDKLVNLKNGKNHDANQAEPQNLKLRCFKLSQTEGKKYLIEEYTTPQGISDVARLFAAKDQPEVTR